MGYAILTIFFFAAIITLHSDIKAMYADRMNTLNRKIKGLELLSEWKDIEIAVRDEFIKEKCNAKIELTDKPQELYDSYNNNTK